MYSTPTLAAKYIRYYLSAFNSKGHGMHSPFVFDFIRHVLNNKKHYQPPKQIEELRNRLLYDKRIITIEDLGAGSRVNTQNQRSVATIARSVVKPPKYSHLLFRLVSHYKPGSIIELGTSLGISTAYLAAAHQKATVITVEGSKSIHHIAKENFRHLQAHNIQPLEGNFDDILPGILKDHASIDLAYIDGNHRYAPTINYFNQFLDKTHNDTILIFDDIHWSREMEEAWSVIQQHPAVRCTIDIFFLGFVFFRNEFREKQHFRIRF